MTPSDPRELADNDYSFPNTYPLTEVDQSLLYFDALESPKTACRVPFGVDIKKPPTA